MINLDEYSDIGSHWVAFYVRNNNVTYFDSRTYSKRNYKAFIDRSLSITTIIFRRITLRKMIIYF